MKHLLIQRLERVHEQIIDIARDTEESEYVRESLLGQQKTFGVQLLEVIGARKKILSRVGNSEDPVHQLDEIDSSNKFKLMQELYSSGEEVTEYVRRNPTEDGVGVLLFELLETQAITLSQLQQEY